MAYEGMIAETLSINGDNNELISAYVARPLGPGPFPGVVLIHHLPGWSEWYREATRRFAHHGYAAISHNLYHRSGEGDPDDVAAKVRAEGGVADAQVIGDTAGAVAWLRAQPYGNGKVGVIGSCSGGRQAFLYACKSLMPQARARPAAPMYPVITMMGKLMPLERMRLMSSMPFPAGRLTSISAASARSPRISSMFEGA